MAKYTGPTCRLARREGMDLMLKSKLRSLESKCNMEMVPGQKAARRGRLSTYGTMLREKQKLRRIYGMLERQFTRFMDKASRTKGSTGTNLIQLLERRLDNVVYRMGFASTRAEARQMVGHRLILVNGRIVNIPSCLVEAGDVVEVKEKAKAQLRVRAALESQQQLGFPGWVEVDVTAVKGTFTTIPQRDEVQLEINENLIVEFYSR
jgi:small subunit ribosomal protein S4